MRDGVVGSSGKTSSMVSVWAVVEDMVKTRWIMMMCSILKTMILHGVERGLILNCSLIVLGCGAAEYVELFLRNVNRLSNSQSTVFSGMNIIVFVTVASSSKVGILG